MQVVVNSPPNFYNNSERELFQSMLRDFENTEFTMAHNATMLWLDAYEKKLKEDHQLGIPLPESYVSPRVFYVVFYAWYLIFYHQV